ncbi:hypothetical protein BKA93DRAFT_527141 [Sparassis latifolia]|uniref:DUF6697 domain-containing protein n=1 Tax=Sparassis crispa TaxID=139825 RepID=A0A401GKQ3_9APHY|nr:hypothetical protein SCP_0411380 [Sparassis crispa]GBE82753.1 hypothetical protein SCP_0411380 [Sparassis crispa]
MDPRTTHSVLSNAVSINAEDEELLEETYPTNYSEQHVHKAIVTMSALQANGSTRDFLEENFTNWDDIIIYKSPTLNRDQVLKWPRVLILSSKNAFTYPDCANGPGLHFQFYTASRKLRDLRYKMFDVFVVSDELAPNGKPQLLYMGTYNEIMVGRKLTLKGWRESSDIVKAYAVELELALSLQENPTEPVDAALIREKFDNGELQLSLHSLEFRYDGCGEWPCVKKATGIQDRYDIYN